MKTSLQQHKQPVVHTPKLTWDYRVVKHTDGSFAIHEIYYTDTNKIKLYSKNPCGIVADDIGDLKSVLSMLSAALKQPVIFANELPGYTEE
jgi:hypothetical protein